MKKTILTFIFTFFLALSFFAQSSFKIFDLSGVEVTNATIQVYEDTAFAFGETFNVKNLTANAMTSRLRKEEITMATGASSSICYAGSCYASSVYTSPCKPHAAGANDAITADYTFPKTYGTSTVRYTVSNCANSTDSASFIVVYNASPAGVQNYEQNYSISEPFPNPASTIMNFSYKLGINGTARIVIHNLLGSLVRTIDISETSGTLRTDISDLDVGMYFYTLEVNNKAVAARKFIIRR
jgi:hypothetical protein